MKKSIRDVNFQLSLGTRWKHATFVPTIHVCVDFGLWKCPWFVKIVYTKACQIFGIAIIWSIYYTNRSIRMPNIKGLSISLKKNCTISKNDYNVLKIKWNSLTHQWQMALEGWFPISQWDSFNFIFSNQHNRRSFICGIYEYWNWPNKQRRKRNWKI